MSEAAEEGFRVVDRRGRGGQGDDPQAPSERPPAHPPPSQASAQGARQPSAPQDVSDVSEPDLAQLFLMLASSALIHLGVTPDPVTGVEQKDLAQAKFSIDLLRLLREKTDGHRTAKESDLLAEILHDLQIQFVEVMEGR
ncbi:MAG: DUF1844 domain-containing protein [Candidatus Methylomirabilia bacterium]